jgi:hypothetical protein
MDSTEKNRITHIDLSERKLEMKKFALRASGFILSSLLTAPHMLAVGGGRLVATEAIFGLSNEVAGPLAYGLSLIMVVVGAISWYRHHHDMGAVGNGAMGTLAVAGIALGSASLLSFIPGVQGAII